MKIKIHKDKIQKFKGIISCINNFFHEQTFDITKEGINIYCFDPPKITFARLHIPKKFFEIYEDVIEDKFVLNTLELLQTIAKKEDYLFELNKTSIEIISDTSKFELPMIVENEKMESIGKEPELKYKTSFITTFKEAAICLSELGFMVSSGSRQRLTDSVKVEYCDGSLYFKVGEKGKSGESTIKVLEVKEGAENTSARFSHEKLIKLLSNTFDRCEISIGENYPITIKILDEDFKGKMILAPRVDND